MRKFISLMSAAAVLASVAVVPISASAEDVFTYDDGSTSGWTTGDSHLLITQEADDFGEYVKITTDGSSTYSTSYALPAEAQLSDNYVIEYDIMYHQSNGMGRYGRYTQAAFISGDAEKDTNDFGTYATTLGSGNTASETGQGYVTGVASSVTSIYGITSALVNYDGTAPVPSEDASGMLSDVWYRVQTIVSDGAATMTVIDGQGNKIIDGSDYTSSASTLSSIFVTVGRGDAAITGGGVVALDNVRIYDGEAEELSTTGLRRALETYTVTYMVDGSEYQTADVIEGNTVANIPDVPEKEGYIGSWVLEDGTAFTKTIAITGNTTVYAQYAAKIEAVAKAAVLLEGDELRISDGTQGAVFRFEIADYIPEGEELDKVNLIIQAAPRSYDSNNSRWGNTSIYTYKVNSAWNGETNEITGDAWNGLSKGDPISTIWTSVYQDGTGTAVAPYQTLAAQDVTDKINDDGVGVFAFKTTSARTQAIDVFLTITTKTAGDEPSVEGIEIPASAKAATKVENDELRISDGTQGAVFRFETGGIELDEGEIIKKATLVVKAAPRSYKESDKRFENAEIWTYKVGSTWNGESSEISEGDWNGLSKNDPINKQYTAKYPTTDPNAVPPYQTLAPIDVTGMIGEDGVAIFAFKTGSAREHAIDATLLIEVGEPDTRDTTVAAAAKASTKIDGEEFRISNGTNGAVYKFDINDQAPADEKVVSVQLYVKAAPRSYKADSNRFESTSILTYKVGSTWNGEGPDITGDDWNSLSKNDPIDTQNTANYPTADSSELAPYQALKPIDVTDMFTDGVATFAFKTGSAREHAIDAYVVVTTAKNVWTQYTYEKDANGVLTSIIMTPVDDPSDVILGANEYLWNQFQTPYVAE